MKGTTGITRRRTVELSKQGGSAYEKAGKFTDSGGLPYGRNVLQRFHMGIIMNMSATLRILSFFGGYKP